MTTNRPSGPDPNSDPPRGGVDAQRSFTVTLAHYAPTPQDEAEIAQIEADLTAAARHRDRMALHLANAVSGIQAEYGRCVISAARSRRLLDAVSAAEAVAAEALPDLGKVIRRRGFNGVRGVVWLWGQNLAERQSCPPHFRFGSWRHARRLRRELQRLAAAPAVAVRTETVAPRPSLDWLEIVFQQAALEFERAADDPTQTLALSGRAICRIVAADNDVHVDGALVLHKADPAFLHRLDRAASRLLQPLSRALADVLPADDVVLGLGGAFVLAQRLGDPAGAVTHRSPRRLACASAHTRALAGTLDVVLARRAIGDAGDIVRRGVRAAHLMNSADPIGAVVH
ncbi:MAG: hypothetical protein ACRC67_37680 [Inquilinus sp.]|uniref:hypothetical protein n=1 Tax=Inquilinus sp. TaxID=1932117 RepID=UPI003F2E8AB6